LTGAKRKILSVSGTAVGLGVGADVGLGVAVGAMAGVGDGVDTGLAVGSAEGLAAATAAGRGVARPEPFPLLVPPDRLFPILPMIPNVSNTQAAQNHQRFVKGFFGAVGLGGTGGAAFLGAAALTGAGLGAGSGKTARLHFGHTRAIGGRGALQCGQRLLTVSGIPQLPQLVAPSGTLAPHFGHFIKLHSIFRHISCQYIAVTYCNSETEKVLVILSFERENNAVTSTIISEFVSETRYACSISMVPLG